MKIPNFVKFSILIIIAATFTSLGTAQVGPTSDTVVAKRVVTDQPTTAAPAATPTAVTTSETKITFPFVMSGSDTGAPIGSKTPCTPVVGIAFISDFGARDLIQPYLRLVLVTRPVGNISTNVEPTTANHHL